MATFCDLAALKTHLRRSANDTSDDVALTEVLQAVTDIMTPVVGAPTVTAYTERHEIRTQTIVPRHGPLVSVASVTPDQGVALDPACYLVDTDLGTIRLRGWFPGLYDIVIGAGHATPPAALSLASKIVCQQEWQVRNGSGGRPAPDMDPLVLLPGTGHMVPLRALQLMRPYLRPLVA